MTQNFIQHGYEIVEFNKSADIYVINTCSVTNVSERKSRQEIRKAKQKNPEAIVIAVGCYAQVAKEELIKIPELDLVLGTSEKGNVINYLEEYLENRKKIYITNDVSCKKDYDDLGNITHTNKTRATIKIQDGCDNFCSYCIIPYARGRVRSRNKDSIIKEITDVVAGGIKEVVLTGIHIASYGKDFENEYRLIDLLEEINQIEGLLRIRLGSLEPTLITDEFVERIKRLNKICKHFHLSLQSGCDETLKRMNRKYDINKFKYAVQLLRKNFKQVILTTDIIVGFPGETEQEFNITYNFLKEIKFYKTHIFRYSRRKGTVADKMENQVEEKIKEQRSNILIDLSDEIEKEYLDSYIGKTVEVLFEQESNAYMKGHTNNYILVKTKDLIKENCIQNVQIEKREGLELIGKINKRVEG